MENICSCTSPFHREKTDKQATDLLHSDKYNEKEEKYGQILRNCGKNETNEMKGVWFSLVFFSYPFGKYYNVFFSMQTILCCEQ